METKENQVIGILRLLNEFPVEHTAKLICQLFEGQENTYFVKAKTWQETIMSKEEAAKAFQVPLGAPFFDVFDVEDEWWKLTQKGLERQAEITWKAAFEAGKQLKADEYQQRIHHLGQVHREIAEKLQTEAKQEGRREVVEWVNLHGCIERSDPMRQAKLKEWGIEV